MRLYVMPTNRICMDNAASFFREILYAKMEFNEATLFLIIGDGAESIDTENKMLLERTLEKKKELKNCVKYVARQQLDNWLRTVITNLKDDTAGQISRILNIGRQKYSYGIILNKLFLIAISTDAHSLHRRDSDTFLETDDPACFPYTNEIKYLGKFYPDFPELNYNKNDLIRMVGSNYYGGWAGDFSRLYEKDPYLLYRHIGLNYPGRPQEEIIELAKQRFVKKDEDAINDTRVVFDRLVELGNCSTMCSKAMPTFIVCLQTGMK